MEGSRKTVRESLLWIGIKSVLILGVAVAFYKLPSIIVKKISYAQIKKRVVKQDLREEE